MKRALLLALVPVATGILVTGCTRHLPVASAIDPVAAVAPSGVAADESAPQAFLVADRSSDGGAGAPLAVKVDDPPMPVAPAPDPAPVPVPTPDMAPVPTAAPVPAADPVPPADPVVDLLAEGRKSAAIDAEHRKLLLEQALKSARAALEAGDLDGGRAFYGRALDLDPQNGEAQEGWKNLNADRPSSTSEYFDRVRREEAVKREQAVAQVAAYIKRGQTLEAQEDYRGAVKEYQSALAIVSWYTNQTAFGATSDSLRDLIDNTRATAATADLRNRQRALKQAQGQRLNDLAHEREERLGRIRAYFKEADLSYRRGEYANAREYARQVLRDDPQNAGAKRLIEVSTDSEHAARDAANKRTFDEEWKNVYEQMVEAIRPQVNTVEFPENWMESIAQRKPRSVGDADEPQDNESKAAIIATLEAKRVKGLQFQDQNLDQVVTYLRTVTGLNFHITPKVRTSSFDNVKINVPGLDDVSVKWILDNVITTPFDLRWEPRDGVVTIAAKDEVAGELRLKYFDVKDLAVKIQNFRGTEIFLSPSNYTPPEPPELTEAAPIFPTDALLETIKAVVDPDSWVGDSGSSIDLKNGTLIVKNRAETIEKVGELLQELRKNSGPMVTLEVRFISAEDNFLRDVGVDVRGLGDNSGGVGVPGLGTNRPNDDLFFGTPANPQGVPFGVHPEPQSSGTSNDSGIFYNDGQDGAYQGRLENLFDNVLGNTGTLLGTGGMSLQHTFLDDTQMEVILRAVQKSERLETITASKVTVYNTQRAVVEVLNKVAYVADYDVEIAQAANIANPIIRNAVDGVVLDVKPVVSSDRRFITLELRPTVATLVRPIPTFSTSLASGPITASAPVIIQVPKLQKSSVRTTVTMPDGATLLIGGLKFYEQVDATSEIPVLGKLPVIGFMFSRKGSFVNRRNLLVLITASVQVLEEQEPSGEYRAPSLPEVFTMTCDEDPSLAPPPPCAPPPCAPPPCAPCGNRR